MTWHSSYHLTPTTGPPKGLNSVSVAGLCPALQPQQDLTVLVWHNCQLAAEMRLVLSLLSMAAMLAMVSATAMTTPFVQNGECVSAMVLTTITTSLYSTSTTITVLASDAAAPAFSSCQPSGWDRDAGRDDMLSFSPAVCPSNWTYYEMSTKKHHSTAYCCAK